MGLTIVGTANFTPQANKVVQKKEIAFSLYVLVK
jgi:hypothetical protein